MRKVFAAIVGFLSLSFIAGSGLFSFSNNTILKAEAIEETFEYAFDSSSIIKAYANAYKNKKAEDGENFDPESVYLTSTNGEITYGIGHGNLHAGAPNGNTSHINAFDVVEGNEIYSAEHANEKNKYAYISGLNYANPYVYTGHYDGVIFWFKANKTIGFSMPEIVFNNASNVNNVSRTIYIQKKDSPSYTIRVPEIKIQNKTLPELEAIRVK